MATTNSLAIFTARDNEPPSSTYATLDTRNGSLVLDFDDSTDEVAIFRGVMPRNYASGGVTVTLHWMATSATSGNAVWAVSFERGTTDLDSDSFATAQTATTACSGTSGISVTSAIAFTDGAQMDSLAAAETFRLKVSRTGSDGSDTLSGDCELVAVEMRET